MDANRTNMCFSAYPFHCYSRVINEPTKKEEPMKSKCVIVMASLLLLLGATTAFAQDHSMSFFITSVGMGKGGDLGGSLFPDFGRCYG